MKLVLIVLLLAGCATPQERQQAYINSLRSQCLQFGVSESAMPQCMMQLHQQKQAAQAVYDANATALGLGLLNQSQPRTFPAAPMTNTRCTTVGGVVNCSSY